MWFAAKEAHERKVAERRRREALATEGRREALPKEPRDRFQEGFRQGSGKMGSDRAARMSVGKSESVSAERWQSMGSPYLRK